MMDRQIHHLVRSEKIYQHAYHAWCSVITDEIHVHPQIECVPAI